MSENPLINIGELSKPATILIEKISDAVGGIFKPTQIIRVAKAEAEAKRIEAEVHIEITELQRRAFNRFLKEEARKQKNIEEITQKALPQLNEDAKPDQVEEDWIANFFDKSRLVSDNEMQNLWSRVLAGEANSPGTYSKRTINLLSSLDKSDADMFTQLCGFAWDMEDIIPLILNIENEIYNKNNINFSTLIHLESIGLIQFNAISGYELAKLPKTLFMKYYDKSVMLEMKKETDNSLELGNVLLTKIGQELASICGSEPVEGFFEFVCGEWRDQGFIVKDVPSEKTSPPVESE